MKKIFLIFLILLWLGTLYSVDNYIEDLEIAIEQASGTEKIQKLNILSQAYRETYPRKSIEYANQAMELSKQYDLINETANSFDNIGLGYYFGGNYDQALYFYQKALEIRIRVDDKNNLANTYINIGLAYGKLSKYDIAIDNFIKSLEIVRSLNNKQMISKTLHNIADVFHHLGKYDQALDLFLESLQIEEELGNKASIASVLSNLGCLYSDLNDLDKSLEYHTRSLEIEKELGNIKSIAASLNNIGLIYKEKKEFSKSLVYLQRSLNLTLEIGDKFGIANSFINIGDLYIQLGKFKEAEANLNQGLLLAKEIDAKEIIIQVYFLFSEYYSINNEHAKSLEYYKLYSSEKDQIFNKNTSTQLAELQARVELSERENSIELLQKNNEIYKLEAFKRNLYFFVLLIGFGAGIGIAGFFYYRLRTKSKASDLLQNEILDRMAAEKSLKNKLQVEETIAIISSRFVKVPDFDKAVNATLQDIGLLSGASRAYIFMIDYSTSTMSNTHEWCTKGVSPQLNSLQNLSLNTFPWWMKKLHNGEIIDEKDVNLMPEEAAVEKEILQQQDIKSILVLPLNVFSKLDGFIGFDNVYKAQKWSEKNLNLLNIAAKIISLYLERKNMENRLQIAYNELELTVRERTRELASTNHDLQLEVTERKRAEQELNDSYYRLKKAMEETVNAFISAVEIRDPYTAGHQLRVATLSRAIAGEMGLETEKRNAIRIAAILHDIGKIYIPNEILTKPDKLTETEYSVVKNHPLAGYDILKTIDFQMPVAQIVYQHHERLDGSGYPLGLSGNEIMMEARIVNVADVVDAMISQRPYRPSQGIGDALAEIADNAGVFYDPQVVKCCTTLFNEKGFQFEEIKIRTTPR